MALQGARPGAAPASRRRARQGDELGEEDLWREALEDSQRVLHRVAVLSAATPSAGAGAAAASNGSSLPAKAFPPQVRAPQERRLSVSDRLYRAHAFMDLAILAHTSTGRRRGIFAGLRAWGEHCRPCLAVVNALTLQLELQMEASARVEGGAKSPLVGLHSRLGLGAEPRDAHLIARLMVEAEVQRRLEGLLSAARRRQQGQRGLGGSDVLLEGKGDGVVAVDGGGGGGGGSVLLLPRRTLRRLSIPLLDLQVVEMAALALAALYRQAVAVDRASGAFEDSRGASRHSIPAVLAALLSCQLAIHLYSSVALLPPPGQEEDGAPGTGKGKGKLAGSVRFTVLRDRPSVVAPQLCDVSAALDRAIEQIVVGYYDSDFASFAFAPLYARLIKMYVESLREREQEQEKDGGGRSSAGGGAYEQQENVGAGGFGLGYAASRAAGGRSPASPPRRRG